MMLQTEWRRSKHQLSKQISSPTVGGMNRLKRVVRSLSGVEEPYTLIPVKGSCDTLEVYSDTDWAKDPDTRKSITKIK